MKSTRIAPLLLIIFISLLATPVNADDLTIHLKVAIVVFDPSGSLNADRILEKAGNLNYAVERHGAVVNLTVYYDVQVDPYQATPREVQGLTGMLEDLYEYPAPKGPRGPQGAARIPLVEAYWIIYGEARSVIGSRGVDPDSYDDIIVIIGDLDGVARYYYIAKEYPYVPKGFLAFDSVRSWGGYAPMTFYDLAAVQAEWPYYKVPFYDYVPPASPDTEPLIWNLDDPEVNAAMFIRDHIAYHVIGDSVLTPLTLNLTVHVVVVDFNNETATHEALAMMDAGEITRLAEALAPWIKVNVMVETATAPEELLELYESSSKDGSFRVLEFTQLYPILNNMTTQYAAFNASTAHGEWTFYVLATPEPAYLTYLGLLNFTGYSTQNHGATSIPGLDDRVYRGGLPAVVAHEIGHLLGEDHPFQFGDGVRWLMDMQATIMSYFDDGVAVLGDYYHYSAARISVLQAIQYAHLALARGGNATLAEQALQAVEDYDGAKALNLALQANNISWKIPDIPPHSPLPPSQPDNRGILALLLLIATLLAACLAARHH